MENEKNLAIQKENKLSSFRNLSNFTR